jgi:hypothetical protein
MDNSFTRVINWFLGPRPTTADQPGHLWPRWIFLRGLGLIYFSAFYSLFFQIKGLIGPNGILPAADYLQLVTTSLHGKRFWFAPSLLWFGAGNHALMALCWGGLIAAALVVLNLWPRVSLALCFVFFLSFVSVAQDFSSYQSDGMLLEAGFIALFSRRVACGLASAPRILLRAPVCFCCSGNGFGFTSNQAWANSRVATFRGAL